MATPRVVPGQASPVWRALAKLGGDLSIARRRRRISTQSMADRVFTSRATITRLERGDPRVSMAVYAGALFVLGMIDRLADLADPTHDAIGLELDAEQLPKRIRGRPEAVMDRELLVHLDLDGEPVLVGRLWSRVRGRESATFQYDPTWLTRRAAFALEPELPLSRDPLHSTRPLFNAFTDPAPDRWGQVLLRRHEIARARREQRTPRTLFAIDFLTLVDDETRLGALRFREPGADGWATSSGRRVPPLLELPRLLAATTRITEERETDDDLRLVLAPGTSLGGARPKASVRDAGGHLAIAKFPRKDDEWPVTRWEATTLALAHAAGITVPKARLELVARRPVVILRRFDRDGARRVPFTSALTALAADDREPHSYLELAALLRQHSPDAKRDLRQLWRRLVFNVLVSNTDDHLRNHGFVREGDGWALAPAYDLNPTPVDVKPRVHALALDDDDATGSLALALDVAPQFGLIGKDARAIVREVGAVVARWRKVAANHGLTPAQLDRMASAFEHDDLRAARSA